jgi:UDP-4-amino-4,6-dideoxy-N-acetyl-beta-L-altrosamine N-acetyltransferase
MKKNNRTINFKLLSFKKIKKNEIEILRKERNRAAIRSSMLDQKIISKKKQIKWYRKIQNIKNSKYFIIYYKNIIIGSASLTNISKINKNCTWGFYIFEKYAGYFGVHVEYKIIDYAFKKYHFHKIYGKTLSTNVRILKIHKKFGFSVEGRLKDQIFSNNKKIDVILTSLFKNNWNKNKKKLKLLFT